MFTTMILLAALGQAPGGFLAAEAHVAAAERRAADAEARVELAKARRAEAADVRVEALVSQVQELTARLAAAEAKLVVLPAPAASPRAARSKALQSLRQRRAADPEFDRRVQAIVDGVHERVRTDNFDHRVPAFGPGTGR